MKHLQRILPVWCGIVCGFIVVLEYFFKVKTLSTMSKEIQSWTVVISAFLLGLGMVNIIVVNFRQIKNRKADIVDTFVLLAGMVVMFVVTFFNRQFEAAYKWMFYDIYSPLSTAVFSLLMFSMATTAFRGLRARSAEAIVLLVSAIIAMLGVAPVGEVIWDKIPVIYDWVLTVPNLAGQRGITIGAAIGSMAASLRVLLGIERRYIGME
ncbi:MAG TPA: hypothetical protein GXX30_01030 [Firmicutes bacterium]|nr:hypothetical protein [Candidatus Fermentithermobacillaceae bacterium]